MRLYLQINSEWVEPDISQGDNNINLDWQYASMDSPADYIGEFALDFLLPRNQHNNMLFDKFYRVDKLVDPTTFDPAIKLPYVIYSNIGQVLSRGTAYIQTVDKDNYKMYLSGSLHTIFSKALNSGWDRNKATEDEDYYLFPEYIQLDSRGQYSNEVLINAPLVYHNWLHGTEKTTWDFFRQNIQNIAPDEIGYAVSNQIVDWIPTHQGSVEDFDTENWICNTGILGMDRVFPIGSYTENANPRWQQIGDDLREYQMAEFRSYNQQPAIYMYRLWEFYRKEFQAMTGYDLELDSGWFNMNNPYLRSLYYTLPKLKRNYVYDVAETTMDETDTSPVAWFPPVEDVQTSMNAVGTGCSICAPAGFQGGNICVNWYPWLNVPYGESRAFMWNWYDYCFLVTIMVHNNGVERYRKTVIVYMIPRTTGITLAPSQLLRDWADATGYDQYYYYYTWDYNTPDQHIFQNINSEVGKGLDIMFNTILFPDDCFYVFTNVHGINMRKPMCQSYYTEDATWWEENTYADHHRRGDPRDLWYTQPTSLQVRTNITGNGQAYEIRSNSPVTLERLTQGENPFAILLRYSKFANLIWLVDDENKKVTVVERAQHFYYCTHQNAVLPETGDESVPMLGIANITKNVDISSEMELTPIDWGDRYLYMNFEKSGCDLLDEYEEKYHRTYGSKMLITPNKRTNETKDMFCNGDYDTVTEAADFAPYYLPIGQVMNGLSNPFASGILLPLQAYKCDTLLMNCDKDNTEGQDVHGQFVFRNPNARWSERMWSSFRPDVSGVLISDDTYQEINEQKYYFHGTKDIGGDKITQYRPVFSPVNTVDNVAWWFAFPRTAFAPLNYAENTGTLYDAWKEWLIEMHDVNNRTIKCRVHITDSLYKRLKLNPLVQIDNAVYIVMKIEGWGEGKDFTLCTLKQFASLENLQAGAFPNIPGGFDLPIEWTWDDGDDVSYDDNATLIVGDGTRLSDPVRDYDVLIDADPMPVLPATVEDIVNGQNNLPVYVPLAED